MSFRQWLHSEPVKRRILAQLAGGEAHFETFVDDVVDYVRRHPRLRECSRDSILSAIAKVGSWGVKVADGSGLLIARRLPDGSCEGAAMLHYRAEIALLKHHGYVRRVTARCVYANEGFRVIDGTRQMIEHYIETSIRLRGELVGGYAVADLPRGQVAIVTLDRADIDQIRVDHSEDWADGELDDIARWYVPKTCVHQLRREIGLPDDFLSRYADDFRRGSDAPPPAAPPTDDIDPFTGMRGEAA